MPWASVGLVAAHSAMTKAPRSSWIARKNFIAASFQLRRDVLSRHWGSFLQSVMRRLTGFQINFSISLCEAKMNTENANTTQVRIFLMFFLMCCLIFALHEECEGIARLRKRTALREHCSQCLTFDWTNCTFDLPTSGLVKICDPNIPFITFKVVDTRLIKTVSDSFSSSRCLYRCSAAI